MGMDIEVTASVQYTVHLTEEDVKKGKAIAS